MANDSYLLNIFSDLGSHLQSENNLSDVTWALATNIENFMKTFIELFGFSFQEKVPYSFQREVSSGENGRPDFIFEQGDKQYIIENKIYDTDYHFEQYALLRRAKNYVGIGIIINHKLDGVSQKNAQKSNFKVAYWESFVERLKKEKFSADEKIYIDVYIRYVKEVCSIVELKEIRFDKLSSLYHFNNLITKIIHEFSLQGFDCSFYNTPPRARGNGWSGQYFSLKRIAGKTTIWPSFGIYFEEEPPSIYMAFEKDWCEPIYLEYKNKKKAGTTYTTYANNWEVVFELNKEGFEKFSKAGLEDQKKILKMFHAEVIAGISEYL